MAIFKKLHKRTGVLWYYVRVVGPDGRRRKFKAGTTERQARKKEWIILGEIASGEWCDPKETEPEALTFAAFADRFLAEYTGRKGKLRSNHYRDRLRPAKEKKPAGIMRRHFGGRALHSIAGADLDLFAAQRARTVGASTLRKDLIVLGTVFKMAVRWGVLAASPAVDLNKPAEPRHRTRYLTRGEWERFITAAPAWLRPVATLAVSTGMRLKEVVSLRWDDVDREAGLLHVAEDTKTGTREVPLGEAARRVLDGQVRHLRSPLVFLDAAGEPFTSKTARERITKATTAAMRRAGIPEATFGTLRNTAASWMVQQGTPLYEVGAILGHSTPVMTQRYAHLEPGFSRRGAAAVDAMLIVSGPPPAPQMAASS